ncbi:hypothetical protein ANCDUO_02962 [Ancylostoma duodenale]|uniref:Uncharacterized protein n=1 Tax=Ancylostoma duodenale TaxID=51022 RepID=A0A0C2GYX7_9BILA|nr:hypothetical protein ANCDUO_02962 [Ancylostoma duodenale]
MMQSITFVGLADKTCFSKIVPLESKYRRGRWNCFDYYDRNTTKVPKPKIPDGTPLRQPSNHRNVHFVGVTNP